MNEIAKANYKNDIFCNYPMADFVFLPILINIFGDNGHFESLTISELPPKNIPPFYGPLGLYPPSWIFEHPYPSHRINPTT